MYCITMANLTGNKETYSGEYYHIYNRGNRQQEIFIESDDYLNYLNRIKKNKDKYKVSVICYCLMPNHFHFLLRQDADIPISKLMASAHTGYSMYFNRKYNKVGHLFQGKYKQKHIDTDEYILAASLYIHVNPYVSGLTGRLEDYQWSSYPDYIKKRQGTLCDREIIMRGQEIHEYKRLIEEEAKDRLKVRFSEKVRPQRSDL